MLAGCFRNSLAVRTKMLSLYPRIPLFPPSGRMGGDPAIYCHRRGLDANSGPSLVALGNLFRSIEHLHWSVPMLAYKCVEEPLAKVKKHVAVLQSVADSGSLELS